MTRVLVVCKTRINEDQLCLGGIVEKSYEKIRLLTPGGDNQPVDTVFYVGDIWECEIAAKPGARKPHTEDTLVHPIRRSDQVSNMRKFLMERSTLQPSAPDALFDGMLNRTKNGSAYIARRTGVPDYAHTFWLPTHGLELKQEQKRGETKNYYYYEDPAAPELFRLPYIGLTDPVEYLPARTLLHLSLARWWRQPGVREKRCFLQLSAFFI